MTIENFIGNIVSGQSSEAASSIVDSLADKAFDALELRKQELAQFIYQNDDDGLDEELDKKASAGKWISDFEASDDPRFEGKSKEKRKQMALAAYYAKQRE